MADETPPSPGASAPGQPERRRPAPTIDLQATEIAGAHRQSPPDQETAANMPPRSALHRRLAGLYAQVTWPLLGAGIAGAILTLGIVWLVLGLGGGNDSGPADARIARLEQQVADLAGRAPAAAANPAANGELVNRLQRLEALAAAAGDPALANRIAAIQTQLETLSETLGTLGRRSEGIAIMAGDARQRADANAAALAELAQKLARSPTPGVASNETAAPALANRLDALEAGAKKIDQTIDQTIAKTVEAELAKRSAENSDDRSARTAIIATALAAAVERGEAFEAELKAAQSQAADAKMLAPLAAFAASGVPGASALARELSGLEPALLQAAAAVPSEGGLLERLQANAERLVRIRPIDEVPGDEPAAVIARVEIKAVRGDLAGALTELGKLPAQVRAPAQAWIGKAQARSAALAASRRFAADTLAALAQPSR